MSSHCTVTRLVRWRVRDLASCFSACRFPLEDERDLKAQMAKGGRMIFKSKRSGRRREADRRISNFKKMPNDDGNSSENGVRAAKDGSSAGAAAADSSWPRFSEEDYIVFCFREDGAIHVINEAKPSEEALNENENDDEQADLRPTDMKVDEKRREEEMESEWEVKEMKKAQCVKEEEETKVESFESCDSNLSDTSTSSFAFPVLSIEWIGSPVQMPKSEKQKHRTVQLHCCRF